MSPLTLCAVLGVAAGVTVPDEVDAGRIKELAKVLPEKPVGVGPTIHDREAWESVAAHPAFAAVIRNAESLVDQPIPPLTDELFLDFSKTGNRTRWQNVARKRHSRVSTLALAECMEDRGRFLLPLEAALRAMCSEKTWVMPAHDRSLRNFEGKTHEIDLAVAGESWNLATVAYWIGEKLSPEARTLLRDELERRTFLPFEGMVKKGKPSMWWLTGTNNWNSVCLAGVTGAALASIESVERRAFFVAAAEQYVQHFLRGFTSDGYCSEGLGYWNYGFGHYVLLAETVYQATGGKLDLLEAEPIERIARFGARMEMQSGVYPAFADCKPSTRPDRALSAFLSRRYGFGWKDVETSGLLLGVGVTSRLPSLGLQGFANSATARPPEQEAGTAARLRDWFPTAGVLICRPSANTPKALAVALKGGHNGEHHNHNDVGSFVVTVAGATPLLDPGGEIYTSRTFSSRRYDSGVINSFGHPVPRVAGQLQRVGSKAKAKVLRAEFAEQQDVLALDLTRAYDVKTLKSLARTFVFSRVEAGSLRVTDAVQFEVPELFETALVTFSPWKKLAPGHLLVGEGPGAVEVLVTAEGGEVSIRPEEIREDLAGGRVPVRLGIALQEPVTQATITLTIAPTTAKSEQ